VWTIGLVWYGLGTLYEIILGLTSSGFVLKLWFLSGAMLTAAWLGQGTIHLLVRKRGVAWTLTGLLTAISLLAVGLIMLAPLTPVSTSYDIPMAISSQYKDIFTRSGLTITLTILLNIYGELTLAGGAIYSGYIFWRKRVLPNRKIGNVLITIGEIAPAMAGSFVKL
jgi:hypothetical protein